MIRLSWLEGLLHRQVPWEPSTCLATTTQPSPPLQREGSAAPEARTATECCPGIRKKRSIERETSGAGLTGLSLGVQKRRHFRAVSCECTIPLSCKTRPTSAPVAAPTAAAQVNEGSVGCCPIQSQCYFHVANITHLPQDKPGCCLLHLYTDAPTAISSLSIGYSPNPEYICSFTNPHLTANE